MFLEVGSGFIQLQGSPVQYEAVPYAFAAADFEPVEAPLVLVRAAPSAMGCPRSFTAASPIAGAIAVLDAVSFGRCSLEHNYARVLAAAGARAVVTIHAQDLPFQPIAGAKANYFLDTDARSFHEFVVLDTTQPALAPLLADLSEDTLVVRARLTSSPSPILLTWASPGWLVLRLLLMLWTLFVLEKAATRLYAFARADGVCRSPSIASMILLLDIVGGTLRLVSYPDMQWSAGLYSVKSGLILSTFPYACYSASRCAAARARFREP
jgi:hypothetical protein